MSDPRYPIGRFSVEDQISPERRTGFMAEIAGAPAQFRAAIHGLNEAQFDTPYREGGWTIRQVIHHVPDSHMNAYIRFKFALTEDNPTIKPYPEHLWANLPDTATTTVGVSVVMLEALHRRWVNLLKSMSEEQWGRTFFHPEHGKALRLDWALAMYAWHGNHHLAHITGLRDRMGWR